MEQNTLNYAAIILFGLTLTIAAFPLPLIGNKQILALFMSGYVIVTRSGGGFGESDMGAINAVCSLSNGWPGNNEHVWPSGPIPSNNRSNSGISP